MTRSLEASVFWEVALLIALGVLLFGALAAVAHHLSNKADAREFDEMMARQREREDRPRRRAKKPNNWKIIYVHRKQGRDDPIQDGAEFSDPGSRLTASEMTRFQGAEIRGSHIFETTLGQTVEIPIDEITKVEVLYDAPAGLGLWQIIVEWGDDQGWTLTPLFPGSIEAFQHLGRRYRFNATRIEKATEARIRNAPTQSFRDVVFER